MRKNPNIDLGLAIASVTRRGEVLSCAELAAYCECSRDRILKIEQAALRHLRVLLRKAGVESDLNDALRGSLGSCKGVATALEAQEALSVGVDDN